MADQPLPEFLEPPVRVDGPVRLVEPDPTWPDQYAREEERIRTALGPRALQVEHVGSTSVPGLAAKPVIDIVLTVRDSADEAAYVPGSGSGRLRAAVPRAGLVRAPVPAGPEPRCPDPRVHLWLS